MRTDSAVDPTRDTATRPSPGGGELRHRHAVVEEREDRPDLCTIYSTAPGDALSTTWLTAAAGSFESLEASR